MDNIITIAVIIFVGCITQAFYKARYPSKPGPAGYPIIGNILQMGKHFHLTLDRWHKQHGDLYFIRLGGIEWAILSTAEVFRDVLVHHAASTSCRPSVHVGGEIIGYGCKGLGAAPYGEDWKKKRKIFTTAMGKLSIKNYSTIIEFESAKLASRLLAATEDAEGSGIVMSHYTQHFTMSGLLGNVFGIPMDTIYNPVCKALYAIHHELESIPPTSRYLVDFFPIFKPFYPHTKRVIAMRDHRAGLVSTLLQDLREREASPAVTAPPCIAKAFLEAQDNGLLDDQDMDALINNITDAGLDTIASLVDWSITLFAVHTSIQKKLHEEMDRVVGRDRLPNHGDIDSLPYLRQTIKEVVRMYAPGFLSVPHRVSEDFVYKNTVIKEGTWVVANRYSIDYDPTIHPDPHTFRPERWQNEGKSLCADALSSQNQRISWVFGAGRRLCIGMHLAEMQVFLALSHLIWSFNIECAEGVNIDLSDMTSGQVVFPAPARLTYTPRDGGVKEMLSTATSSPA